MSEKYKYLFGPVPSRRLGRSLGIDVTPDRSCSFDCLFCQCGRTRTLTAEREEFVPFEDVCAELERWLAEDGAADVITFAGSGEPTLYSRLGELIAYIKEKTDVPVIVLSNGTLLHRPEVREDLQKADIVKSSLSCWDEASFQTINRPAPGVTFDQLLAGALDFKKMYQGTFWLEVFLMEGINADPAQVRQIAAVAATIRPDKIHLNTAVRPPAEAEVRPVSKELLESFCGFFTPTAEVIASFAPAETRLEKDLNVDELADLIRRHPATAEQLAEISGATAAAVESALAPRLASGELEAEVRDGKVFFR